LLPIVCCNRHMPRALRSAYGRRNFG
jgi:hypothetical protein